MKQDTILEGVKLLENINLNNKRMDRILEMIEMYESNNENNPVQVKMQYRAFSSDYVILTFYKSNLLTILKIQLNDYKAVEMDLKKELDLLQ